MYLVKYALTSGIEEVEPINRSTKSAYIQLGGKRSFNLYKKGVDVVDTKDEAIEIAENMRKKKIASLKKSLAKFEKMKF